jgi:hypothetical protein
MKRRMSIRDMPAQRLREESAGLIVLKESLSVAREIIARPRYMESLA